MPIYEYKCGSCEKLTEAIQRLDEPPLSICPHCGGSLEKMMSAPSFQFKGTGWYVTDYADKKGPPKDSHSDDAAESGKASSSSDSGSKPDSVSKSDKSPSTAS